MSDYMFDSRGALPLRALSLYHGWMPPLLLYLVNRTGYDRRAFAAWTALAWPILAVCYFFMPGPGTHPENVNTPVNINYVFGMSDERPQTIMPPGLYFAAIVVAVPSLVWYPTHRLLMRFCHPALRAP